MAEATLSRGSTSVSLPLIASGSTPIAARDIGKPNLNLNNTGELDPRVGNDQSALETITLLGRFHGSNAFSDANTLADLIKSNSNGTPLTLNINMPEWDTDIEVAPAAGQEEAVALNYPAGKTNTVEVDLGLSRVSQTFGGTPQQATTPTGAGSGPVQISDGTTTVDLTSDLTVSRSLGRPQSQIKKHPVNTYPTYYDKTKTAYEGFEIQMQFNDSAVTESNNLADLFRDKLSYDSLTLDFQGLYGLGAFDVVPSGSGALRHVREAGRKDQIITPTISLRRVF
jgi:hypothetical protein